MNLRQAAAFALTAIGADAVPAPWRCLKDEDADVRLNAAGALGQIGPKAKAATAALASLLKDKGADVRLTAAEARGFHRPGRQGRDGRAEGRDQG